MKICHFTTLLFVLAAILITPQFLHGQSPTASEQGRYYLDNFDYKTYGAHQENWDILQSPSGLIYAANNEGLLEFDGISWRLITTPKNTAIISIAVDSASTVYAGLENDFGYFRGDARGQLNYVSLGEQLADTLQNITTIWKVHNTRFGTYFFSIAKVYFWADDSLRILPIRTATLSTQIGDDMYYGEYGSGIMRVVDGEATLIHGGDRFAREENFIILPYKPANTLMVATREEGLFIHKDDAFQSFPTDAEAYLTANRIYSSAPLPDGHIALGTIRGGAMILDAAGKLQRIVNKDFGLRDQTIVSGYTDNHGTLWLALLNGLARVEFTSPFTRYTADDGLESGILEIVRHKGILYAGSRHGVYYLDPNTGVGKPPVFKTVEGISSFAWKLHIANGVLLAGTDRGVFEIEGGKANFIDAAWPRVYDFHQSRVDSNKMYVALLDGFSFMTFRNGHWDHGRRIQDIHEEVRTISGDENDVLWLGTVGSKVIRAELVPQDESPDTLVHSRVRHFSEADGLPGGEIRVFTVNNRMVIATSGGFYRYDAASEKFYPDSSFGPMFTDPQRSIRQVHAGEDGRIWIASRKVGTEVTVCIPDGNGGYQYQSTPFQRMVDIGEIEAFLPETDEVVWFGGSEGIVRYQPGSEKDYSATFPTLIRQVIAREDSLLFAGKSSNSTAAPVLAYRDNVLRFEFSAAYYDAPAENRYQYFLDGFAENWSGWTADTRKDYTNLPEGDYRFRVRAKNLYGQIGNEAVYAFSILPPWYRSGWAYLAYLLAGIAAIYGFTRFQVNRYRRQAAAELEAEKNRSRLQEAYLKAETAEAQKEVEKEQMRSRIASDLHDEIGSNLSSIAVISQMLQRRQEIGDKEQHKLREIQRVSQQTATAMRDIVWFVNPINDTMEKLFGKMRQTANLMLDHIDFTFQIPDAPVDREPDLNFRRNLYLTYKEALQNIVKHADAKQVDIAMAIDNERLILKVRDDGIGFDPSASRDGNGLNNFGSRAAAMGGAVTVSAAPQAGTVVLLDVPWIGAKKDAGENA